MKLTNPTDEELNAAFAEKVAGYADPITLFAWHDRAKRERPIVMFRKAPKSAGIIGDYSAFVTSGGAKVYCGQPFDVWRAPQNYTTSADAVLPWLEKERSFTIDRTHLADDNELYRISLRSKDAQAMSSTFPRAAVIALLRAHNVEIEFTK